MGYAATRRCNIRRGSDEFSLLTIAFGVASRVNEDEYEAWAQLECVYFARELPATGHDGVQALLSLPLVVHGYLQGLEAKGYTIYWLQPGDLYDPNFWGVRSLTLEI